MSEPFNIPNIEKISFAEGLILSGIPFSFIAFITLLIVKRRKMMQRQDFLESLIEIKRAELLSAYLRYPERARAGILRGDSWANMLASFMVNHARSIYTQKRPGANYAKALLSKARNRRGILLFLFLDDVPQLHKLIKQENQNILTNNDDLLNNQNRKYRHWGSGLFIRKAWRKPS